MPEYNIDGSVMTSEELEIARIMEQAKRIVIQQAKFDHYSIDPDFVTEQIEEISQGLFKRFSAFERKFYLEAKSISDRYYPNLTDTDWQILS